MSPVHARVAIALLVAAAAISAARLHDFDGWMGTAMLCNGVVVGMLARTAVR